MICRECGTRLRVTETRNKDYTTYRTYKCTPCNWIFTTREDVVEGPIPPEFIKKRDWSETNAKRKKDAK